MTTKRTRQEARHRWTNEERARLAELSLGYETVSEAADGIYVTVGQPRQAVYAQLYQMFLKGLVPHLSLQRPEDRAEGYSAAFIHALREVVRVMRVESLTDVMISLGDDDVVKVETVHKARKSATIEFK